MAINGKTRVTAALAAVLLACIDGPSGPGNQTPARLRVVVTLPAATPSVWQPSGDTLHLEIRRAGRADPIIDTAFVPGAALSAEFLVPLGHSIERFVATAEVRYGGLVLFLAFDVVQLAAAGDTMITLPTTYVGPGARAASYALGARDTTLAQGDTASLVPVVRDSAGLVIPNVPARYIAARPAVVSVDSTGLLTGQASGSDTASVTGYLPMGLSSALIVRSGAGPRIPLTRSWVGGAVAGPTDWSVADNWDPPGVPFADDSVAIDDETNDPALTANAAVASLRLLGGNLTLGGHTLVVAGDFTTENGAGSFTMQNALDTLRVLGNATFSGDSLSGLLTAGALFVAGDFRSLTDGAAGTFRAIGNHRTVLNGTSRQLLRVANGDLASFGHLDIATAAGGVTIGGEETIRVLGTMRILTPVAFDNGAGGNGDVTLEIQDSLITVAGSRLTVVDLLLHGALAMNGDFAPQPGASFTVTFLGNDQTIPAGLTYQDLRLRGGAATLAGPLTISGSLAITQPTATLSLGAHQLTAQGALFVDAQGPVVISGTAGSMLETQSIDVANLTLDGPVLAIGAGSIGRLDTVTFQNQPPTATQLTVANPGTPTQLTFRRTRFLTTPTSGLYVSATDAAPADGDTLKIKLENPDPADGTAFVATGGGAQVVWGNPAPTGPFFATGAMTAAHANHGSVLLFSGKVLVVGGLTTAAELYDTATGTFSATTGSTTLFREGLTATTLYDGRVLVTGGGQIFPATTRTAELFDPATGTFALTDSLGDSILAQARGRRYHTATLLGDGRVIVVGGEGVANSILYRLRSAESYSPISETFTVVASPARARSRHTASLLSGSRVLICGGQTNFVDTGDNHCEIYDANTDTWSVAGALTHERNGHTATTLADGRILVTGGSDIRQDPTRRLATAELYDPATGSWSATGSMTARRQFHTATLLADGRVLVVGGLDQNNQIVFGAELFDPVTGTFSPAGSTVTFRDNHAGVRLPDGRVLITGGANGGNTAELYIP